MTTPRKTERENFRIEIDTQNGGQIVIEAGPRGTMLLSTTSPDSGKGHWVTLNARDVFSLKGAIHVFEEEAIRNRW